MTQTVTTHTEPRRGRHPVDAIRAEGLYRWNEFEDRIPFSRETWRQRVKAGRAPKPESLGENCTVWRGADLLAWLDNPAGYKAADDSKH